MQVFKIEYKIFIFQLSLYLIERYHINWDQIKNFKIFNQRKLHMSWFELSYKF